MKKYYFLIVIALILGLVLTGCSLLSNVGQVPATNQSGISYLTKATEGDPFVTTLFADQDIDVGTVSIWNDDDYLYVTYNTTSGWVLTETHLHVATSLENIPQKNGNPIPGKFEYKGKHAYETVVLYEIPLIWNPCIQLFIAAHAKVVRPIDDCYEPVPVWQIGDVETNGCNGNLTNYANEFNWKKMDLSGGYTLPVGDCEQGPSLSSNEPLFTTPFMVGTTKTNEFPYNSNYSKSYATQFDVEWSGSLPFGGRLILSWSPGRSGNEIKKISGDGISSTTLTGTPIPDPGWFNTYPLVEDEVEVGSLPNGLHTINFQHTQGDGTFWDWIKLEKPCVQEESAWADGPGFIGKNWATYFNYTVDESYIVGTWIMDLFVGTDPIARPRTIIIDTQVGGVINGDLGVNHPPKVRITGTIEGTIECLEVYMFYERPPSYKYTAEFWGTMSLDGESVSGTWKDINSSGGTWTAYRQ